MRKNQQGAGNNPNPISTTKTTNTAPVTANPTPSPSKTTTVAASAAAGNLSAPASTTSTLLTTHHQQSLMENTAMAGFSHAVNNAEAQSFLQPAPGVGVAANHLTPHHSSHLTSNQNLSNVGLPSPMGLGASAAIQQHHHPIGSKADVSGANQQMAFGQIFTSSNQDGKSGQLTAKQINQIGKDLEFCATHGDADEMQEILARHQDVIQKKVLNVALRAAVKGCTTPKLEYSIQCCQHLIEAGANINSEEANEGKTALMMSCEKGYLELVKNLLDNEALIDHKDQQKRTSLMYAINANAQNEDVVQELLNRGADVNDQTLTGLTPLLLAVKKSHTRICKLLLSRGADIAAQFPEDLNSSLHYACIQGNILTLNTLLDHSRQKLTDQLTREFLYLLNKKEQTALQIASEKHTENPDNRTFEQIYSEMSQLYQQKDKAVDEVIETLLSDPTSAAASCNTSPQTDPSQSMSATQQKANSATPSTNMSAGKRQAGGRNQQNRASKKTSNVSDAASAQVSSKLGKDSAVTSQTKQQPSASATKKTGNNNIKSDDQIEVVDVDESSDVKNLESKESESQQASSSLKMASSTIQKTSMPQSSPQSKQQETQVNQAAEQPEGATTPSQSFSKKQPQSNKKTSASSASTTLTAAGKQMTGPAKKQANKKQTNIKETKEKTFAEAVQDAYKQSKDSSASRRQLASGNKGNAEVPSESQQHLPRHQHLQEINQANNHHEEDIVEEENNNKVDDGNNEDDDETVTEHSSDDYGYNDYPDEYDGDDQKDSINDDHGSDDDTVTRGTGTSQPQLSQSNITQNKIKSSNTKNNTNNLSSKQQTKNAKVNNATGVSQQHQKGAGKLNTMTTSGATSGAPKQANKQGSISKHNQNATKSSGVDHSHQQTTSCATSAVQKPQDSSQDDDMMNSWPQVLIQKLSAAASNHATASGGNEEDEVKVKMSNSLNQHQQSPHRSANPTNAANNIKQSSSTNKKNQANTKNSHSQQQQTCSTSSSGNQVNHRQQQTKNQKQNLELIETEFKTEQQRSSSQHQLQYNFQSSSEHQNHNNPTMDSNSSSANKSNTNKMSGSDEQQQENAVAGAPQTTSNSATSSAPSATTATGETNNLAENTGAGAGATLSSGAAGASTSGGVLSYQAPPPSQSTAAATAGQTPPPANTSSVSAVSAATYRVAASNQPSQTAAAFGGGSSSHHQFGISAFGGMPGMMGQQQNTGGHHAAGRMNQEYQAFFGGMGSATGPGGSSGNGNNIVPSCTAGSGIQSHRGVGGQSQPGSAPITLYKSLESKKTQLDFILEQQEMRNKILTYQLYQHQEKMREIEHDVKLRKQDHIIRVNEYYNQAQRYYENFRQLENQMNNLADINEQTLSSSMKLLNQLRDATKGFNQQTTSSSTSAQTSSSKNSTNQTTTAAQQQHSEEVQSLIRQIQENLYKIEENNKKFTDEIDFRKEDEKSYIQTQCDKRKQEENAVKEQNNLQADMALMKETQATKQTVAKTQIQYNNLFIEMENAFGEDSEHSLYQQSSRYPQQVFNKLHDEVILFDESVKSIMDEIEPIKTIIIDKIYSFIKQVIPNGDVEVYGSHATKLCLHWSDIDLVLKPATPKDRDASGLSGRADEPHNIFQHGHHHQRDGASGLHGGAYSSSNATNMRNWLNMLYNELIKSENRGWLQKVDFIENTTVPVIKLACNYQYLQNNGSGQLLLPNGQVPRYPAIVCKPINVDITLWTENHNGLPCVKLVKSYLAESQLIEPLILVLKQMLKVWGFNDAYTGGLSSYALFLMIVSFLQEKRKPAFKSEVNLGETLLELIRYYAQLDFSQYAICCKMPGEQSDKQNLYQNINTDYNFFMQPRIVIDDPLMASNNVGKSAFRFQEIKNIMSHAYNSVFTGCFCSCHVKSMCRNTNYHQNPQTYHKSQLVAQFGAYQGHQLPQAPHFLNFQHPPNQSNYNNAFGVVQQTAGSFGQYLPSTSTPSFNTNANGSSNPQLQYLNQTSTKHESLPQLPITSTVAPVTSSAAESSGAPVITTNSASSNQQQVLPSAGSNSPPDSSDSQAPSSATSQAQHQSASTATATSTATTAVSASNNSSTSQQQTAANNSSTTTSTSGTNAAATAPTTTTGLNDNNQQNGTRAPYPADMAPQLRTQSQPFQISITNAAAMTWHGQNQFYNQNILQPQMQTISNTSVADIDTNCSCDSILSRLIYGYQNYRRTMESLHPNFGALQIGGGGNPHHNSFNSVGGHQGGVVSGMGGMVGGPASSFGLPGLGGMSFMGGQNL